MSRIKAQLDPRVIFLVGEETPPGFLTLTKIRVGLFWLYFLCFPLSQSCNLFWKSSFNGPLSPSLPSPQVELYIASEWETVMQPKLPAHYSMHCFSIHLGSSSNGMCICVFHKTVDKSEKDLPSFFPPDSIFFSFFCYINSSVTVKLIHQYFTLRIRSQNETFRIKWAWRLPL